VLGPVNLRIQKGPRTGPIVVHVDKVNRYFGETPVSWLPDEVGQDTVGTLGPNDLTRLFQDHPRKRDADIVNNEPEIESKKQPQRNAPRPARFLSRVYMMPLTKEKECFRGNKGSQASAGCEVESKSCVNHRSVFLSCICRASKNSAPSLVSSTEEQIWKHGDRTPRSKRKIAESREDGDKTGSQVPIDVPTVCPPKIYLQDYPCVP